MTIRLPSFSSVERAIACPLSCALPHVNTSGKAAKRGTQVHRMLQQYAELVAGGMAHELAYGLALEEVTDDDARTLCEAIDVESLFVRLGIEPADLACEVAFAWDFVTGAGRVLGYDMDRDYSTASPDELCGTADVVSIVHHDDGSTSFWCGDYKTGRAKVYARDSWQLKSLALAGCRAYGCDSAVVTLAYILPDGTPWFDRAEFDAFALLRIERELSDAVNTWFLAQPTDTPHIGPQCEYCPALADCPGTMKLVRLMATEPVPRIDQATAREAYYQAKLVQQAAGAVLQAVKGYASQWKVDLGNGKLLGPVETSREELDGAAVYDAVETLHGEKVARAACEFSASKASITRALKEAVPKGKGAEALRKVLAVVKEAGGITVKKGTTITEHAGSLPQLTEGG